MKSYISRCGFSADLRSICVCTSAIALRVANFDVTSIDITWDIAAIGLWATAELNLVMVSVCFPTILPAFMFLFNCCIPGSKLEPGTNLGSLESGYTRSSVYQRCQGGEKPQELNIVLRRFYGGYSSTCKLVHEDNIVDNNGDFASQSFNTIPRGGSHAVHRGCNEDGGNARTVGDRQAGLLGTSIKKETTVQLSEPPRAVLTRQTSCQSFA